MLKDLNIDWVILGHSERREIFKEAEELVADKVAFAVRNGLRVIACCGEKLQDRQSGKSMQVVINQLKPIAAKLNEQEWSKIVIAYEPVVFLLLGLGNWNWSCCYPRTSARNPCRH